MATSESDDFESADEEMTAQTATKPKNQKRWTSGIGSDSDDDVDYIPVQLQNVENSKHFQKIDSEKSIFEEMKIVGETESNVETKPINESDLSNDLNQNCSVTEENVTSNKSRIEEPKSRRKDRPVRQQRTRTSRPNASLGATKLGTRITTKLVEDEPEVQKEESESTVKDKQSDWPDELKSNLKFKEIFKPDGWEGLSDDVELPEDFSDDKFKPVLDKLATKESKEEIDSWSSWGSWGVSSLLNTASAGVSTLTSHVTHGLTLLEESMGVPAEEIEKKDTPTEEFQSLTPDESNLVQSFGFNLISGVSSLTKLVESTGTKVITGGLDTLETIGKKTMQVLQEGDPGLKKKRAFFTDADKPILSKMLREAKEKADMEEKITGDKHLAKKVHFETLFDDYHGLVHLEALEMLSKQCNMKIQQQLLTVDGNELTSLQETLEEIKELCDLGDDDESDDETNLKEKLYEVSQDIGVVVTFDKLLEVWDEINSKLEASELTPTELFQSAISALAQFTALSVERFHKTAELLLIKERRSTVNEADALVQLTKCFAAQVGVIASLYCKLLNEIKEDEVSSNITTVFLEATNASSYIQEAFRLLIPILQVGAV